MSKYLKAQCRSKAGGVSEIRVLDISEAGCMIDKRLLPMLPGDRILIKLEGLTYLPSSVLWVEDDEAGLSFEQPMYGPVLDHVRQSFIMEDAV